MFENDSFDNHKKEPKDHDMLNMYGTTKSEGKDTRGPRAVQSRGII
jgi:hypothetical protein